MYQPIIDSVAQLVEQVTLNHWVVSSSLTGVTTKETASSDAVSFCFYVCMIKSGDWVSSFVFRWRRSMLSSLSKVAEATI